MTENLPPSPEPQGIRANPYERAIGRFNESDVPVYKVAVRLPMSTDVLMDDFDFAQKHPWLQSDRWAKPNAWPRFHLLRPFRLRRGGRRLRDWWVTLAMPRETKRFLAREDFDPSEFVEVEPFRRGGRR